MNLGNKFSLALKILIFINFFDKNLIALQNIDLIYSCELNCFKEPNEIHCVKDNIDKFKIKEIILVSSLMKNCKEDTSHEDNGSSYLDLKGAFVYSEINVEEKVYGLVEDYQNNNEEKAPYLYIYRLDNKANECEVNDLIVKKCKFIFFKL